MLGHNEFELKMAAYVVTMDKFYKAKCNWKGGFVDSNNDWKMIEYLYEGFRICYPEEAKIFIESQKRVKATLKTEYAEADHENDNSTMRQLINMPQKLHELIRRCYPNQKWGGPEGKKFAIELCRRMPVLSVPNKL